MGSCVEGAIPLAVVGLNRRTNSFVMCGSSALGHGGTSATAMRCWHFAAPSITVPSLGYLNAIDSDCERRKNHRMLLLHTYTIITTQPNAVVGEWHDRMPVILQKEDEDTWLNPDISEPAQLLPLLKSYPAEKMADFSVVLFRPDFVLFSEQNHMKSLKNQRLLTMPYSPKGPAGATRRGHTIAPEAQKSSQ
jgi:hypothetical protein